MSVFMHAMLQFYVQRTVVPSIFHNAIHLIPLVVTDFVSRGAHIAVKSLYESCLLLASRNEWGILESMTIFQLFSQ